MPFPEQIPKAFSRTKIENLSPGQTGCYGLYRESTCVYVGRGDIRNRLLAHFNGDNPCITREGPTHFVTVVTTVLTDEARERELITELDPICNRRVG